MLDWPYAHLLVNHFPLILTYIGAAAVLVARVRPRRVIWQGAPEAIVGAM